MILYFSGTGNTKYCAQEIGKLTNEKVVSINTNLKKDIYEIDMKGENTLGIFSPTYDYNLPWTVSSYIEKLELKNLSDDIYTYGIFTCGGDSSAMCAKTLEEVLNKKNITLNFNTTIPMPDNYLLLYKLDTSKNDSKQKKADKLIKEVAKQINNKETNEVKAKGRILASVSKLIASSQKSTKGFEVSDECIGCSLCSKVCPLNIIEMKDNKPTWKDKECACCLSCINRCPKKAISKGAMSKKNEHYVNKNVEPDIK